MLDRFSAKNPSTDEKVWKIWVPTLPEFVDGDTSTPRPGLWGDAPEHAPRQAEELPSVQRQLPAGVGVAGAVRRRLADEVGDVERAGVRELGVDV